jgi:hypothetical protein
LFAEGLGLGADNNVGVVKVKVGCEVAAGDYTDKGVGVRIATSRR